ncbi:MAG: hypothetical protein QW734_04685 [Candidatus Bathyarchaeia archaeon]
MTNFLQNETAIALDSCTDAEADTNVGMTPAGLVFVFAAFMRAVARASVCLSPEIAEELYTEMIQEGFSNAIQTSIGGALQSILNVWRGGQPINQDEIPDIVEMFDYVDVNTMALTIAMAGANLPTTAVRIAQGYNRFIESEYSGLRGQVRSIADDLNEINLWNIRRLESYALRRFDDVIDIYYDMTNRYIAVVNHVCERALTRLQEIINELETVKAWLDYSLSHPGKEIISEEQALMLAVEAEIEVNAISEKISTILDTVESAWIESMTRLDIEDARVQCEYTLTYVFNRYLEMLEKAKLTRTGDQAKIDEVMAKISAYRHRKTDGTTEVKIPVKVSIKGVYGQE